MDFPSGDWRRRSLECGPVFQTPVVTGVQMTEHAPDDHPEDGGDVAADAGDDRTVTCAECGAVVDTSSWYPVVGCEGATYDIYHFCDRDCRDDWTARHC